MSSQKSDLPTHPAAHEHVAHEKEQSKNGERVVNALELDPFAAPSVYYGSSHSPRKVAKSRTLSAVSCNPLTVAWHMMALQCLKRWCFGDS